jgi:hypothetical protein
MASMSSSVAARDITSSKTASGIIEIGFVPAMNFARQTILLPQQIDFEAGNVIAYGVDRHLLRDLPFHDPRYLTPAGDPVSVPLLAKSGQHSKMTVIGIAHHSFCGSTVLSRVLEDELGVPALREPYVLTQIADRWPGASEMNESRDDAHWPRILETTFDQLLAAIEPEPLCILKLHERGHVLLPHILERQNIRILLYLCTRLEAFLNATLVSRSRSRAIVENSIWLCRLRQEPDSERMFEELFSKPAYAAAYFWCNYVAMGLSLRQRDGTHRVRLIDVAEMISSRGTTVGAELAGLVSDPMLRRLPQSPWWHRDAKHVDDSGPIKRPPVANRPSISPDQISDAIDWLRRSSAWDRLIDAASGTDRISNLIGD